MGGNENQTFFVKRDENQAANKFSNGGVMTIEI